VAPPPQVAAVAAVAAPVAPPPVPVAPAVHEVEAAPPPQPDPRTKTEIFRDRMSEIKKNASTSNAAQNAVPNETNEPAPRKKGCMRMVMFGFTLVTGVLAGSWNWIF